MKTKSIIRTTKTYVIKETCVACGACKMVCPTHCIQKGLPYTIQQHRCIRCGRCTTRCWRQCIVQQDSKDV